MATTALRQDAGEYKQIGLPEGRHTLAQNYTYTQDVVPVEKVAGQIVFDASKVGTDLIIKFSASVTPSAVATTEVRLYDRGASATPAASNLVATLSTATSGLEILSETLTAVVDPSAGWPDNNQIYTAARIYEVRVYMSSSSGDTVYVGQAAIEVEIP
ncbi:hypothetical protein DRO54_04850 [Candidatus Bathyarchaeota archaeon]|nr:MAG: hypothetical protein DRO54_04850 [Candidatus Bathyarchaeota archaeon]